VLHSKGFKQLPMHDSVPLHRCNASPPNLFQSAFKAVLIPLNRADFDELVTQARKQVEKGENVFRPVYVPSPLSAKRVVCIE